MTCDQEGHWTPMNRINWIRPGGFYGNMMAANPQQVAADAADLPLCWIHREMDRSPTEQLWVPLGQWGPLEGALLSLSYGTGKTWRVLYEQVGDIWQGGIAQLPMPEFPTGIQRGRFHPRDGMLYLCGLFGWSSDKTLPGGLYRVRYTGRPVRVPDQVSVSETGVLLHFSLPLNALLAADRNHYAVSRWNYQRTANYGSDDYRVSDGKPGRDRVQVTHVSVSRDAQSVFLHIPHMVPCMQMRLKYQLQGADGAPVAGVVDHTVHVLPALAAEVRERFEDRLDSAMSDDVARREVRVETQPGLVFQIASLSGSQGDPEVRVVRTVALRADQGRTPAVFVPGGPFAAAWSGFIRSDLAMQVTLQAEFMGRLLVKVNGNPVLHADASIATTVTGGPLSLHAGLNDLSVHLTSLADGHGAVRLLWQSNGDVQELLRPQVLVHDPASISALASQNSLRTGRELVGAYHCGRCHAAGEHPAGMPELNMDSPSLVRVGDRLSRRWIERWIRDPQSMRNDITMPRVLESAGEEEISDIVAYLESLRSSSEVTASDVAPLDREAIDRGLVLYEDLGCIGCHHFEPPGYEDPYERTSLHFVGAKYRPGALTGFLLKPHEHYAWRRMPDFRLSTSEALALAAYLRDKSQKIEEASVGDGEAARGKQAFVDRGCLACHAIEDEAAAPVPSAQPLFAPGDMSRGCLSSDDSQRGSAPLFDWNEEQRDALIAFLKTGGESLAHYVPAEAAQRFVDRLRCSNCHRRDGQLPTLPEILADEGGQGHPAEFLPPLTWAGEKLQPDWLQQMLEGTLSYNTRPWKRGRMAAFPAYARVLTEGLAAQHGVPGKRDAQPSIDSQLVGLGERLTQPNQGFNCLQCHGLPGRPPEAPFESRGIDFQHVKERLRHNFYQRWTGNPIQFDAAVPMPRFSPDGKTTPVAGILDGDAQRQFNAIWQYLQTVH